MTLSIDDHQPNEYFAVEASHRPGEPHILLARGRLTAAGGELLYGAISTACEHTDGQLVADLAAVTGVELVGWAWLLPAMQECRAAGCELRIVPPSGQVEMLPPGAELETLPPSGDLEPAESRTDPVTLRCYPDGPILVRGNFELIDRDCQQIPRNRSVLALCRCGGSAIKPFCDGTHKTTRFTDG